MLSRKISARRLLSIGCFLTLFVSIQAFSARAENPLADFEASLRQARQRRHDRVVSVAEQTLQTAGMLLETPAEGFAVPFYHRIESLRDDLQSLMEAPELDYDPIEEVAEQLQAAVRTYREVPEFPPLEPILISEMPAILSVSSHSAWNNGLMVNVMADANQLALPEDKALRLSGRKTYVETGFTTGQLPEDDKTTISFWIYPLSHHSATVIEGNVSGGDVRWEIAYNSTGSISLRNHGSDSRHTGSGSGSVPVNEWTHVAVTYDKENNGTEFYINGDRFVSIDNQRPYSLRGGDKPLRLGGKEIQAAQNVVMRNVRIWDSVLSREEVQADMYEEFSGGEEGLLAYWPLNEGEGEEVLDKTPAAHHGQILGGVWVPEVREGYWLSNPIAFQAVQEVEESLIEWETDGSNSSEAVIVNTGVSNSEDRLPETWRQAENGGGIPGMESGTNSEGLFLWVKTELVRTNDRETPRLDNLRLEVSGN